MAKIHELIPKIMAEVDPIAKSKQGAGYKFRGVDDVYAALQLILAKHGVFTVPEVLEERSEERLSKSGGNLIYRILKIKYHFFADDGSFFPCVVIGEGMDSGDKASNKAMSVAHKYACIQTFLIPTSEPKDPELDGIETSPKQEFYAGTPEQKKKLFAKMTGEDVDLMKDVHQSMMGVEMTRMEEILKKIKDGYKVLQS